MTPNEFHAIRSRREFFRNCAGGIGTAALAHLLSVEGRASEPISPLAPKPPHFKARAKNVIFMFMEGAPSQMDLFDPKPELQRWNGKPLPESRTKNLKLAFIKPTAKVLGSTFQFQKQGQCGMELSELVPHLGTCADDICLVRSMHSEAFNHHPGQLFLFTGHMVGGRPTMGAWVTYGLGSESQNLPGFVVLSSGVGTSAGSDNFSSGFLPSTYAGTPFRSQGDPILYLSNPKGFSKDVQRARLDLLREMNQHHQASTGDVEIASRIHSYELAYRLQSAGPELLDFSKGIAGNARSVWHKPGSHKGLRRELPAGAPNGRARRALHDDDACQLGSSQRHVAGLKKNCGSDRSAQRGIAERPETARLARRYARRLGRRVRPHAYGRNAHGLRSGKHRPRSSSEWLQHLAGRRRDQRRPGYRRNGRLRVGNRQGSRSRSRLAGDDPALPGTRP